LSYWGERCYSNLETHPCQAIGLAASPKHARPLCSPSRLPRGTMKRAPRFRSWRSRGSTPDELLSGGPNPLVDRPSRERPQNPLGIPSRHASQLPGTHRLVPPRQKTRNTASTKGRSSLM